ncbi:hypothetical protein [Haloglycomyces albus]|uniref:hypothetical protein n=1 Tax=Haloglycomyces albus TaxID=526067 RepID=UPI0004BB32FE|nr:hypothetical protein [Haloglycomyces albus]
MSTSVNNVSVRKKFLVGLGSVALAGLSVACIGGEEDSDADAAEETGTSAAEESKGIGAGTWEVGEEISPGTYVTTNTGDGSLDLCYVARLSGFSGELDDLVANENIEGGMRGRVTVTENDAGVEFTGDCRWQEATDDNLADAGDPVSAGIWEVGSEIEPGTYTTVNEGEDSLDLCYVARLSGFTMSVDDLISNENIDAGAQGRITVDESDAGVLFSGDCQWDRK